MASCILCQKGLQEQFVAKSNGGGYVRCSNGGCGYFCSLADLLAYGRVVQLDMASAFTGQDAPLCQHQKACALRVSRLPKNDSRPYCLPRALALHLFLLGRFGSEPVAPAQPEDTLKSAGHFFGFVMDCMEARRW